MNVSKTSELRGGFPVWSVTDGVRTLGTVYRRRTSKTGFRRRRCIGQVEVVRWFARTPGGEELDGRTVPSMLITRGFATRAEAVRALEARA